MTTALDEQLAAATRQIVVGWSALSVDIETNPAEGDRIFKIGAVRSDNLGNKLGQNPLPDNAPLPQRPSLGGEALIPMRSCSLLASDVNTSLTCEKILTRLAQWTLGLSNPRAAE